MGSYKTIEFFCRLNAILLGMAAAKSAGDGLLPRAEPTALGTALWYPSKGDAIAQCPAKAKREPTLPQVDLSLNRILGHRKRSR